MKSGMNSFPWMSHLKGNPLPWLLEEQDPEVRYLTLRDLLDRPADDPELVQARSDCCQTGMIARVLEEMNPAGYWEKPGPGYYPTYFGSVWSIILLAQLGADWSMDGRIANRLPVSVGSKSCQAMVSFRSMVPLPGRWTACRETCANRSWKSAGRIPAWRKLSNGWLAPSPGRAWHPKRTGKPNCGIMPANADPGSFVARITGCPAAGALSRLCWRLEGFLNPEEHH